MPSAEVAIFMMHPDRRLKLPFLELLMDPAPLTAAPDMAVIDVVALMHQAQEQSRMPRGIDRTADSSPRQGSCVIIVDQTRPIGIFTSRDLVRLMVEQTNLSTTRIGDVMTQPLLTLTAAATHSARRALSLMHQHQISYLPIVNEQGALIGLVSQVAVLQVADAYLSQPQAPEIDELEPIHREPTSEELQIVLEELRLQNEALAASQLTLTAERQHYHDLFELTSDGYLMTDRRGTIREANHAAAVLLATQQQQLIGKSLFEFLISPERMVVRSRLRKMRSIQHWQLTLVPHHSEPIAVTVAVSPLQGQPGQRTEVRWLLHDSRDCTQAETALQQQFAREQLVAEITQYIRQSLDVTEVLHRTVERVRQLLATDRVIIFRFQSNWQGTVVMESVGADWMSMLSTTISDPCFRDRYGDRYRQGRISVITNLHAAEVEPCHAELLEHFQVRANLVVPILQTDHLWGLLIAHHCSAPREWQPAEIDLLQQLATQVGIAIQQSELYQQTHRELAERQRMQEVLQASEERFRCLSASAPIGICQTNADGICLYTNPRWQELSGLSLEDSLGNGWLQAIHPDDRAAVSANWEAYLRDERDFVQEFRLLTPAGETRWISAQAAQMRSATGEIIGYVRSDEDITAWKQAEAALLESQAQLQQQLAAIEAIYQSVPIGLNVLDADLRFVRINQRLAEINGLPIEAHIGRTLGEVLPDLTESAEPLLRSILVNGEPVLNVEIRGETPAQPGVERVWLEHFWPLKSGDRVIGISTVCEEITDRKRAEEELRNSEARYRLLFESNPNPLWVFDLETLTFLAVNQAAIAHYGYSREEFLGMTIADIRPPADVSALHQVQARVTLGQNYIGVWQHLKKDGSLIDVEIVAHTFSFMGRQACLVLVNDITDRLQAEQKIREQAALINIASDAIFVQDLHDRVLFWSQGAERLYGWTAAEILGQPATAVLYKQPPAQLVAGFSATIEHGFWQAELDQTTKTGRNITVASRWTLVKDATGSPTSILVVNTDITEKKQLQEQIYRAQRLESLGILASGIAHDLNNVFTPILAIAQLLLLKPQDLDARSQEMLQMLVDSAKRGADLVKQVLSFSRGTEGKPIALQVEHVLLEVTKIIKQTFPKSIQICTNISTKPLALVSADFTQLHQVFMNLCVNARDAMPTGGTLTITAENRAIDATYAQLNLDAQEGNYLVVTVCDTGVGIPPHQIDRIFDPFFTTKEFGRGTGLGLSTVLGIVKNHGGFVQVSSQVGQGTQFQIYLPAIAGTATQAPATADLPQGQGELVLIVDDEVVVQQAVRALLEDAHYQTLTASDGIEAIALYVKRKQDIKLVLLDMMMPNMDGITTIQTLHKINPQVKIIASSGLPANRQQALAAGAMEFLPKPYTSEELLRVLQGAACQSVEKVDR